VFFIWSLSLLSINKSYNNEKVASKYILWYNSDPIDIGLTTRKALFNANNYKEIVNNSKKYNMNSLSNGCLMRISPLAIYGLNISNTKLKSHITNNCKMTNPNEIAIDSAIVYVLSIKKAIKFNNKEKIYNFALKTAKTNTVKQLLKNAKTANFPINIKGTPQNPDSSYMGYFGFAFQNAFYQLLNGNNFYDSLIDTISMGGDTDTNGCIAGALLGAYYGYDKIPKEWIKSVDNPIYTVNRLKTYPDVNAKKFNKIINSLINN